TGKAPIGRKRPKGRKDRAQPETTQKQPTTKYSRAKQTIENNRKTLRENPDSVISGKRKTPYVRSA
ncbi:MAG: hypothetical protein ACLR3T_06820, partial [Alistipes finegoldii]